MAERDELVLVTGGSGFVAAHCILQLLASGYRVRTTLRTLRREAEVLDMLRVGGTEPGDRLSFMAADLTADAGWPAAVAGCSYVLHVASPIPPGAPKHEDDLIIPACDGALRVLRAARDAGVRRVVLTSSFGAMCYGPKPEGRPFSESDWTEPHGKINAYVKSKTLAEQAAWDFIAREGGKLELSVINPGAIFGPVLGPDYSVSADIVRRLLERRMPACPRLSYGIVDVRDVADLHLRAMTDPAARGERFIAVAGDSMTVQDIARLLKVRLGNAAAHVPTRLASDWVLRLVGLFDPTVAQIVPSLGLTKPATNAKAKATLGWSPRSNDEAILATAESLLRLGLLKTAKAPHDHLLSPGSTGR
jgi:nucleoside-diphosphate-sugar epimerase